MKNEHTIDVIARVLAYIAFWIIVIVVIWWSSSKLLPVFGFSPLKPIEAIAAFLLFYAIKIIFAGKK